MKNYWKSRNNVKGLIPNNKIIRLKIIICLLFFKFALRILPFSTFKALYKNLTQSKKKSTHNPEQISIITEGIKQLCKTPGLYTNCLTQALTTKFLLRSDRELVLIIGVNIENGFEAHAWVEKSGVYIIGDTPLTKFTPLWQWA